MHESHAYIRAQFLKLLHGQVYRAPTVLICVYTSMASGFNGLSVFQHNLPQALRAEHA